MKIVFDSDYMNFNYVDIKDTITGIEGNQLSQIQIYPNPFTAGGLLVEVFGSFEYEITDVNGHLIESGIAQDSKLIGQVLNTGVYFLNISNQIFKIVKY